MTPDRYATLSIDWNLSSSSPDFPAYRFDNPQTAVVYSMPRKTAS